MRNIENQELLRLKTENGKLKEENDWLRKVGSTSNVEVTYSRGSNGRVACQPAWDWLAPFPLGRGWRR